MQLQQQQGRLIKVNGVYYMEGDSGNSNGAQAQAGGSSSSTAAPAAAPGAGEPRKVILGMRVGRCWGCDVTRDGIFVEPRFVFGKPYSALACHKSSQPHMKSIWCRCLVMFTSWLRHSI